MGVRPEAELEGSDTPQPGGASRTRRALLAGAGAGLAGAGALLLGGCGGTAAAGQSTTTAASPAVRAQDIAILTRALELERRTVAAYVAGIPLLPHDAAKAAQQFLSEELEHTGELISLIKASGGKPAARPNSYALGHPTDGAEVLALLHSLERLQLTTYLQAIPRLSPGPVRAGVASILTVDAQHVSMLRLQQGQTPVPSAFVTGAE
ncbi:MAG TPA: ferritin-like domain-containing protein [Solirubrobacteraceae bacterium]|nr:ferritin-like domain-containing protein [Solirubrobacteraceae bacterium]